MQLDKYEIIMNSGTLVERIPVTMTHCNITNQQFMRTPVPLVKLTAAIAFVDTFANRFIFLFDINFQVYTSPNSL